MSKYVVSILLFYLMLHIAKLEVFPFYHFGMYSQYVPYKAIPFVTYDVYIDEVKQSFESKDYRQYTYLMNSIKKYDQILDNDLLDDQSAIVSKYLNVLGVQSESITDSYKYPKLKLEMDAWIKRELKCLSNQSVIIEKSTYRFDSDQNYELQHKKIILP